MPYSNAKSLAIFIERCKMESHLLAIPINQKQTGLNENQWACFPFPARNIYQYFTNFPQESYRASLINEKYIKVHNGRLYIKFPQDPHEFAIDTDFAATWNVLYMIWLEMRMQE